MHFRLFVLTNKENAKTSKEARYYVLDELGSDSSFVGEGGRFGSPIADWFVIGGRWSGELTRVQLDQDKLSEFWTEFENKKLGWTSKENSGEEQAKKAHKLFLSYFPDFKGVIPVYRGDKVQYNFGVHGCEDDAMIVTKDLWKLLKREYKGNIPEDPNIEDDGILDLEQEPITEKNVVDKKWVVMVDYHM